MRKDERLTVRRAPALGTLAAPAAATDHDAPHGDENASAQVAGDGEHSVIAESAAVARIGFAPIVRVDALTREVELCATSESVDSHGTVFDYAASKDAFTRWIGNVREMHERRAVGTRVAIRCDDEARKVFVRIRISRGAEDTWQKVLDGTLRGASIGASNVVWERQRRSATPGNRGTLNVATRYDLVELSLVDNPSNPDALGLTIVRDAMPDVAILDMVPDATFDAPAMAITNETSNAESPAAMPATFPRVPQHSTTATERHERSTATQPISNASTEVEQVGMPEALRSRLHAATEAMLRGCGCPFCAGALAALGAEHDLAGETAERAAGIREVALARTLAVGLAEHAVGVERLGGDIRSLHGVVESALDRMASVVGDLGARIGQLEAQPLPGGPLAHSAHAAYPVEKAHALARGGAAGGSEPLRALEALAGRLRDPQAQVAVAAELIRLQQEG